MSHSQSGAVCPGGGRLDIVIDAFTRSTLENESQQRTMLRLSLEADPAQRGDLPLRQGRGIKWIDEALAPLETAMPESERQRLVLAVRSATGIEALVWLTDVAGLSSDEAIDVMRRSAQALLRSALADDAAPKAVAAVESLAAPDARRP